MVAAKVAAVSWVSLGKIKEEEEEEDKLTLVQHPPLPLGVRRDAHRDGLERLVGLALVHGVEGVELVWDGPGVDRRLRAEFAPAFAVVAGGLLVLGLARGGVLVGLVEEGHVV